MAAEARKGPVTFGRSEFQSRVSPGAGQQSFVETSKRSEAVGCLSEMLAAKPRLATVYLSSTGSQRVRRKRGGCGRWPPAFELTPADTLLSLECP
jgi:hypothetical protein